MTPVIRIIMMWLLGKWPIKRTTSTLSKLVRNAKKLDYYKDKATQTAALRVTNNSHFREASSLKLFCYTFKFPLKATRLQGSFLHTTQYIFKPLVSHRTTDPQFMFLLLRCASATKYMSRKQKSSKCKLFTNDWHHKNCLVTFFNENKTAGSWGTSIPKSINRTRNWNWTFLQMIETKKIEARL